MSNLEIYLSRFAEYTNQNAIVWNDEIYTYAQLLENIKHYYDILIKENIERSVVCFPGDYSPDVISLFFALARLNNILVPLNASGNEEQNQYLNIANARYVISLSEDKKCTIRDLKSNIDNKILIKFMQSEHPGIILFTSGSTGTPKGILHNFDKMLSRYTSRKKTLVSIAFLALDHIGGINTLLYQLANGGTVVTTDDRRPENICRLIEKYQVELLPVSPTFLNLLFISGAYKDYDLSSLKIISYGTEVMPESTLSNIIKIFPDVKLKQTYGLSELGILASKSENSSSKWVKLGGEGYQLKVVDNILWIKTDSAMVGYLNSPSPFDEGNWFNTGDMVEIKGDYLKILGRESEIINVGGLKVFPQEVENLLIRMPEIEEITVFGEPNAITGNIVAAIVRSTDPSMDTRTMRKLISSQCKGKLERYKIPAKIYLNPDKQHNYRFKKIRSEIIKKR